MTTVSPQPTPQRDEAPPRHVPNYVKHAGDIRRRIMPFLDPDDLKRVQTRNAVRHFLVAGRHVALTALCAVLAIRFDNPWIWLPAAALQGINILGYTILLHDAIHQAIFKKTRKGLSYFFALLYMLPAAMSASQFERWHLDHHAELGTDDNDPKRAYLTPKIVTRLMKCLYMTPALFVIYSIASQRAARNYSPSLKRRIALEKAFAVALHVVIMVALWRSGGFDLTLRAYIVPFLFMFPIAFTINRMGQHYDIDPSDPAKWGTLVPGDPITNFVFLNSNFHLEHHYFPRVPLYNLPELHRMLIPFFEHIDHKPKTYGEIMWGWFVLNRDPHTNWEEFVEP